jgi:hypothetical protein
MKSTHHLFALLALVAGTAGATPVNLIANADFEAAGAGWSTDYRLTAAGCIGCVGVAATTLGWYNLPAYVFPFGDHTTGNGLMLQYDPPNGSHGRIWYQSVNVEAGLTYAFSGWVREANSEPSPNNGLVGVYADGQLLGQQAALDDGWVQWSFSYTATQTGAIELALRDLYPTTFNGTYSVIDDLSFAQAGTGSVPEPASLSLCLAALAGAAAARRKARPRG